MRWIMGLAVLLSAFEAGASRARLRAFNQDSNGSFYVQDARNMFLNPAYLAAQKESLLLDWGKTERTGTTPTSAEAEGGYVREMGKMNLALQLGRVNDFAKDIRAVNANLSDMTTNVNGGDFAEGQNNVDVLVAGEGDVNWGGMLSVTRSKASTGVADKQAEVQAYEIRGGVLSTKFDVFGSMVLGGQSVTESTTDAEFEQKFSVTFGGGAQMSSDHRMYAKVRFATFDAQKKDNSVDYDGDNIAAMIGVARTKELNKDARFFAASELSFQKLNADDNKASNIDEKYEITALPITLGIEADANTWLKFRGSVKQGILLGRTKTTAGISTGSKQWENAPNDTSVSGGVGAVLNNFNIDMALVQSTGDDHGRGEFSMLYTF